MELLHFVAELPDQTPADSDNNVEKLCTLLSLNDGGIPPHCASKIGNLVTGVKAC
jgi:hypothetical protein